ncbi:MAG: hypothetical protein QXQ95_08745 [Thermofilum sp.]|uniref:hypothetical protein n=1 Tax=Thermofilum sp. TaxID=1961369 RepID=UPI0031765553
MYTLQDLVTDMVVTMLSETLISYIEKHGEDSTRSEFIKVFSWMVENDVDFLEWVKENKPHWLKYASRVRRVRKLIRWDTDLFLEKIVSELEKNGIVVGSREKEWIRKTLEEVKQLIYG